MDDDILAAFMDPRHAVDIKHELPREPKTVSPEVWLHNNKRLIRKMGAEWWLDKLLYVLETGGSKAPSELRLTEFPSDLQAIVRDIA